MDKATAETRAEVVAAEVRTALAEWAEFEKQLAAHQARQQRVLVSSKR
jgi:hypothetical protein